MKKKFIVSMIVATFLLSSFSIVGCDNEKENALQAQDNSGSDITSSQDSPGLNNEQNAESNKTDSSKNKSSTSVNNSSKDSSNKKSNSSKKTNDTNIVKGKTISSIYKPDTSKAILDEVKDKYNTNMNNISSCFGKHFITTGELIFSDKKAENDNYTKEFYNKMDSMLNELWNGLKTILSDSEMKELTQEQVQWIKQKDSINKEGNEILTAKANTLYARGQDTYKRCLYLSEKYLNY